MKEMTFEQFCQLAKQGNVIPVYKEILADLETPVTAYMKLAHQAAYAFLLESVEGGEKFARFSIIARKPRYVLRIKNSQASIISFYKGKKSSQEIPGGDKPFDLMRELMAPYKPVMLDELPAFYGGLVGYLGYDTIRYIERLPHQAVDDLNLPDICMMLADELVVFDHRRHTMQVIACVMLEDKPTPAQLLAGYKQAMRSINGLIADLAKALPIQKVKRQKPKAQVTSNVTQAQFERMVKDSKKHIHAGDIFQIVLSQRFCVPIALKGIDIYRSLRVLNPSPYMFLLALDGFELVGASPELLVRAENGLVQTRPIAGTRRRGKDQQEDLQLEQELLADPKEKAEHIMLVDLGRNDLGRVCEQGSVRLSEFMAIERFSHVMHICSNVTGKLRRDKDALDLLQAAFPAGTVSGAPKIRAMELIEQFEGQKRGPYAGAVGYWSFSKNLDTCITIRTILVCQDKAYVQAGAGIVADSIPVNEYKETVNKAKAQIKAIELAYEMTKR